MTDRERYEAWLADDGPLRVEGWAREGLADWQIARKLGIDTAGLREWRARYPELEAALRKGRAPAGVEAENALFKAAVGYTVTVRKPFKLKEVTTQGGGRAETERIEYAEEQVHVPPRITALIFWLKNRLPERWRDRPEVGEGADDPLEEVLKKWGSE